MNYTLETRAVNSKRLLANIQQIEQVFTEYQILWSNESLRNAAIEMIDSVLEDIAKNGRITQWNVICDYRNNKVSDMAKGIYRIEITYRQANCLNTTVLKYELVEDELTLDYDLGL